jgi:AraC-like DNA-binding protein
MPIKLYTPSPALSDFITYYYCVDEHTSENANLKKRIPDGTVELFFHYRNPFYKVSKDGNSALIKEKSIVLGQLQDFIQFKSIDDIGFIGVKFKAQGFHSFVDHDLHQFTDKLTDIKDIWGNKAKALEEGIANLTINEDRIALIESFLLKRLNKKHNQLVDYCIRLILQNNGNIRVSELARQVNISTRQLERKFLDTIGISPNCFSRISRMQQTLISIENRDYSSLTQLGYHHGYYDQSHFIKEIDKFVGMTPRRLKIMEDCYSKTAFL